MAVYRHTKDSALREKARSITEWTQKHLADPADGLYWDSLNNSGRIDKTKWTYNTALMIRAMHGLGIAGVERVVQESKKRWLVEGSIKDPGRFSHLLLEAWVEVEGVSQDSLAAVRKVQNAKSANGHYPGHWGDLKVGENPEILDQAAFARACFYLANRMKK